MLPFSSHNYLGIKRGLVTRLIQDLWLHKAIYENSQEGYGNIEADVPRYEEQRAHLRKSNLLVHEVDRHGHQRAERHAQEVYINQPLIVICPEPLGDVISNVSSMHNFRSGIAEDEPG